MTDCAVCAHVANVQIPIGTSSVERFSQIFFFFFFLVSFWFLYIFKSALNSYQVASFFPDCCSFTDVYFIIAFLPVVITIVICISDQGLILDEAFCHVHALLQYL